MTDSTLFVDARVFTGRHYCEALLIENGAVLVAGTETQARRASATGTDVRSLVGGTVIPGLIDAHFHVDNVTRLREGLDLRTVSSLEVLIETVHRWAELHPSVPVVGRGWDPEGFPGRQWPTRHDLDRASIDRSMVIVHTSGHAGVANSAALAAAGMDRSTADPPGGRMGREADGTPDGRLFESAVDALQPYSYRDLRPDPAGLLRTLRWAASLGLTTIGAMSASPEEGVALRGLAATAELPNRVRVYLRGDRWREYFRAPSGPEGAPGRFAVIGVKAYLDGAFGPRTAWLSEPYADDGSSSGMRVATDGDLRELLAAAGDRGLSPALHAIGDRALELALRVLEEVPSPAGRPARIEHAALTPPALFPRLAHVRPALVVQPGFVWSDHWLTDRLGPARARWAYAFRSLVDHGYLLVGSSDAPYDPVDPWRGLRAAVHRTDPAGRSANAVPSEALGAEEAVRLYTSNAGEAMGDPGLGRLDPGSPADLLVLGVPSLEAAIGTGRAGVRETWVAGVPLPSFGDPADGETV